MTLPPGTGTVEEPGEPVVRSGTVRVASALGEGALVAGARVRAYGIGDPVEVETDENGAFTLPAIAAGAEVLVTAPGLVPSLLVGWREGDLTLHATNPLAPFRLGEVLVPVHGQVVDPLGGDLTGLTVSGGNGRSTTFGPLVCAADGTFSGLALSNDGATPSDVAVWAVRHDADDGVGALGLKTGCTVGEGSPAIELTLGRPLDRTSVGHTAPAGSIVTLEAVAPNGYAVTLAREPLDTVRDLPFFTLDEGDLMLSVVAVSPDGRAESWWRQSLSSPGSVRPDLLPFPTDVTTPVEGQLMSWSPVAGATGYRVSTGREGVTVPTWEAYTTNPRLVVHGLPEAPGTRLELVALDGDDGLRRLASLDGPRQLRWFHPHELTRWSARKFNR